MDVKMATNYDNSGADTDLTVGQELKFSEK